MSIDLDKRMVIVNNDSDDLRFGGSNLAVCVPLENAGVDSDGVWKSQMSNIFATASLYIVDKSEVPTDELFFPAFKYSEDSGFSTDITKAKEITKQKLRADRIPLLEAQDVAYMKALEADDADAKAAAVTAKTNLRNAPAASAITDASDIAALKAAWDTSVLGDSPYA